MIGKFQIQLGAEQFISGMSSSDFATDGALGVSSTGLNPFSNPGVINAMTTPTNLSTNLVDDVIASSEDSQLSVGSSYKRTFIGDAGNYYTLDSSLTVTKTNTATTNAANYTAGLTDMVSYNGNTYVSTSNGDIDKWNTSSLTLTNSWWVGTKGQTAMNNSLSSLPHPMIVYAGILYVAGLNSSGAVIHGINASETIDSFFPALPLQLVKNEIIYALGIDPATGLMMISVQTIVNIGASLSSRYYVYLWDGVSAQYYRKIPTDDLITAFHNVEGVVFCPIGTNLGQWNGNGVTFLRKLKNATQTSTDLVYKQHISSSRNILHIADGNQVLSYGTVIQGKPKGFFYTANTTSSNHINALFTIGDYNIGVADNSAHLYSWSYVSTSAGTASLYFNNIYFPRPIFLRRIRVITTGITTTAGIGGCAFFDEKNNTFTPQISTFIVTSATSPRYVFDFDFTSAEVQAIQPKITIDTQAFGIVRVYAYYDIAQ